ncbi:hypothetical protein XELAEV_18038504mg [Xenopus laevis]|uniref:Uncharacterized protein n=1 Tax=Xenopus laevis TaxID=8355 RepID=A0A974C706_XENLA|nr:hypothetical protein XELAEV_18038504mg [Xenopus laevis]
MPFHKRTLRPQSSWGRRDHSSWCVGTSQCLTSQNEGAWGYHGDKQRTDHESQETLPEQIGAIHAQPGCVIPYPKTETGTQGQIKTSELSKPRDASSVQVQNFTDACLRCLVTLLLQLSDLCRLSLSLYDELEEELLVLHRRTATLQHRTAATYMTICKARQRGLTTQHGNIVLGEGIIGSQQKSFNLTKRLISAGRKMSGLSTHCLKIIRNLDSYDRTFASMASFSYMKSNRNSRLNVCIPAASELFARIYTHNIMDITSV